MIWNFSSCSLSLENNAFPLKVLVAEHENSCYSIATWHHTSIGNDLCTQETNHLLIFSSRTGKKKTKKRAQSALSEWIMN